MTLEERWNRVPKGDAEPRLLASLKAVYFAGAAGVLDELLAIADDGSAAEIKEQFDALREETLLRGVTICQHLEILHAHNNQQN